MDRSAFHRPSLDAPPTQAEFDALTELFLGEGAYAPASIPIRPHLEHAPEGLPAGSERVRAPARKRGEPVIEAIIRGHLPVLGAAWVSQHARHTMMLRGEPVALVRLIAGRAEIEAHFPAGEHDALALSSLDAVESLAAIASRCRHFCIDADEPFEPDFWSRPGLCGAVVLSGVDQAALVNAYRVVKELARAAPPNFTFRLAFMGAPATRAAEAGDRIVRAARAFLSREVQVTPTLERIGPSTGMLRVEGLAAESAGHMVELIHLAACVEPEPAEIKPRAVEVADVPEPAAEPAITPTDEVSLAEFIGELDLLPARCPYAPGIELAVAADGRLHLLARCGGESTCGSPLTQGRAIEQLTTTSAWALAHAALLGETRAGLRIDGEHLPILHLVTDRPRDARRLLESEIRVHLLARAESARPWVYRDLN